MTAEEMFRAIDRYPVVACNALVSLYQRQTSDEQAVGVTAHDNGVGFSGCDAGFLSSLAEQVLRNRSIKAAGGTAYATDRRDRQLACLRKKLVKYRRQLLEIVEEKAAARAFKQGETAPLQFVTEVAELDWNKTRDLVINWADGPKFVTIQGPEHTNEHFRPTPANH